MIIRRSIRAIPYLILSALAGLSIGWAIDANLWLSSIGAALFFALLAGRDIWKDRHIWNDMEKRGRAVGLDIRAFM